MTVGATERSRWELAAESVVVKLRWFGVVMGYILVQTRTGLHDPWAVRAFLALGAGICRARPGVLADGRGLPQTLAALRFLDGIALHHAALLSRHRALQPVSLVLPAFADLLLDPLSVGRGVVDSCLPQRQPAGFGPNSRRHVDLGIGPRPDLDHHGVGDVGVLVAGRARCMPPAKSSNTSTASSTRPAKSWNTGSRNGPWRPAPRRLE